VTKRLVHVLVNIATSCTNLQQAHRTAAFCSEGSISLAEKNKGSKTLVRIEEKISLKKLDIT